MQAIECICRSIHLICFPVALAAALSRGTRQHGLDLRLPAGQTYHSTVFNALPTLSSPPLEGITIYARATRGSCAILHGGDDLAKAISLLTLQLNGLKCNRRKCHNL